ncbi:16890_t:CDS:1, partial [Gigaspora rosea]
MVDFKCCCASNLQSRKCSAFERGSLWSTESAKQKTANNRVVLFLCLVAGKCGNYLRHTRPYSYKEKKAKREE